jgi:hypothetical protein
MEHCPLISNEHLQMAIHKWFQIQKPNFYYNNILKLGPRWDPYTRGLNDYVKK